ncbi:MAG: PDZ domain-containing protein [Pirellulales bacterium]|nr:PDZ domain-containing protein [Pirellulales bacterium]
MSSTRGFMACLTLGLTVVLLGPQASVAQDGQPPAVSPPDKNATSQTLPPPEELPLPAPPASQEKPDAPRPRMGVMLGQSAGGGVLITDVVRGSPAFNAGLRRGDYIMRVGDQKVSNPDTVIDVVAEEVENDRVKLVIWRDARAQDWEVDLRNKGPVGDVQPQRPAQFQDDRYLGRSSNSNRRYNSRGNRYYTPYYDDPFRRGYNTYPYYGTAGPRDYFYSGRNGYYNNRFGPGYPGYYGGNGLYLNRRGGSLRINGFGVDW